MIKMSKLKAKVARNLVKLKIVSTILKKTLKMETMIQETIWIKNRLLNLAMKNRMASPLMLSLRLRIHFQMKRWKESLVLQILNNLKNITIIARNMKRKGTLWISCVPQLKKGRSLTCFTSLRTNPRKWQRFQCSLISHRLQIVHLSLLQITIRL